MSNHIAEKTSSGSSDLARAIVGPVQLASCSLRRMHVARSETTNGVVLLMQGKSGGFRDLQPVCLGLLMYQARNKPLNFCSILQVSINVTQTNEDVSRES